jgi:hypothetical protein
MIAVYPGTDASRASVSGNMRYRIVELPVLPLLFHQLDPPVLRLAFL